MQTSLLDTLKKSVARDLAAIENALELISCTISPPLTSPRKRRPSSRIHSRKLRTTRRAARSLHRDVRTGRGRADIRYTAGS
jgi:hypothetical protein